jgi:hypothetical protein
MASRNWRISIRPLRSLLIAGQNLVCVSRSGNRKQRQNRNYGQRFHAAMVVLECGQKRQSLAPFWAKPEKQSWPQFAAGSSPVSRELDRRLRLLRFSSQRLNAGLIFRSVRSWSCGGEIGTCVTGARDDLLG